MAHVGESGFVRPVDKVGLVIAGAVVGFVADAYAVYLDYKDKDQPFDILDYILEDLSSVVGLSSFHEAAVVAFG